MSHRSNDVVPPPAGAAGAAEFHGRATGSRTAFRIEDMLFVHENAPKTHVLEPKTRSS
jgi:hypothetical protein